MIFGNKETRITCKTSYNHNKSSYKHVSPITNISTMPFTLTSAETLWIHATRMTHAIVWLMPPVKPHSHFTHATHTVWQICTINVPQRKLFSYRETPPISSENIRDFENLLEWWLSKLSQKTKSISKVSNIVKNIATIYVILMILL